MILPRYIRIGDIVCLRFTGKARHKKFYMTYNDYIDSVMDAFRFFEDHFISRELPDSLKPKSKDHEKWQYFQSIRSSSKYVLTRVTTNLREFTPLGFITLTKSEQKMGSVTTLTSTVRKKMAEESRIYVNRLPGSSDSSFNITDFCESETGKKAYQFLRKNHISRPSVEFYNYPNRSKLLEQGFQEVPSITCLAAFNTSSGLLNKKGLKGIHLTSKSQMVQMLLENVYSTIIENTLVDINVNLGVKLQCKDVKTMLTSLYNHLTQKHSSGNSLQRLYVVDYFSNEFTAEIIHISRVDNPDKSTTIPTSDIILNMADVIKSLQGSSREYEINYEADFYEAVDDAIRTVAPKLHGVLNALQDGMMFGMNSYYGATGI